MTYQASAWYRHSLNYLTGIDPHLADMFVRAMKRAGFPTVGEAAALEAILADFLAGYDLHESPQGAARDEPERQETT